MWYIHYTKYCFERTHHRSIWFGFGLLCCTKKRHTFVCLFFFVRIIGLEQQQRRPLPAAETGRSCWDSVLIFQSPAKGLRKNQQTQPVRPCASKMEGASPRQAPARSKRLCPKPYLSDSIRFDKWGVFICRKNERCTAENETNFYSARCFAR